MKRVLPVVLAAAALLAAYPSAATATKPCRGDFEGTVLHGPNAGFSLVGVLTLDVDASGSVSGTLKRHGEQDLAVTGRIEGESIHLVFHLRDGPTVSGIGPINKSDFAACSGVTEGTLRGPDDGDTGNWGVVWGE